MGDAIFWFGMLSREEVLKLRFDERGLIPAIIQDARTGEVLMLGYMSEEAVKRTFASGEVWFWSRSRRELWHKGETSGNFLYLRSARVDCDEDALLLQVEPAGPVCHTGNRSCFYRSFEGLDEAGIKELEKS